MLSWWELRCFSFFMSSSSDPSPNAQPAVAQTAKSEAVVDKHMNNRGSRRAVSAMIILLFVAGLAILLLSSPADRHIYIAGELPSFRLPQAVELDLPRVKSIHLRRMQIDASRVSSIRLRDARSAAERPFSGELSIMAADGQVAATALLRPNGRTGPFALMIPEGTAVSVRSTADGSLFLKHMASPGGKAVTALLEADELDVAEANRVRTQPSLLWAQTPEPTNLSLVMKNADEMVQVRFWSHEESTIELATTQFSWLRDGKPMPLKRSESIALDDFRVTTVALQGVKDADTNTASASSMEILPGNDFAWIAVDGVDQTVGQAGAVVRLAGKGNVKSLRQDGREVLPSRAADLISADPARRGVYGGAALFVLFAWGVLFKRAVDILAKILLPE